MTGFEEKVLGGVAVLLIMLVAGTVFGRVHGSNSATINPLGDRVACGLLALPLISLAVLLAFPSAHLVWALSAPLPLAIYVVLLAGTEFKWKISKKHFTAALILGVIAIYVIMAVSAWITHA
ncbi:MAG: hypothetical protein A2031_01825 [Deltaproteobacteria bacterium RBG_19FT_COMBO_43_11]|nr:MAG: hypothetical protein A2031_01825 [Deltaproteobacteria bacterium RBG_19FT_COMBO_43_11]